MLVVHVVPSLAMSVASQFRLCICDLEQQASAHQVCYVESVLLTAGIMAVEAYHAGYIRTALIQNGDVVTPYGANVTTIINAISAARESLDGADNMAEEGIFNATTGDYTLAPVDENAVAFSRNPAQVLAVAYLNANGAAGGFFPNGVNGKIQYA